MNRDELLAMDKADAVAALADEANWPAMGQITRALWQHLTPEQRYAWIAAPHQECNEPRADGRYEHPSSIPRAYRKHWRRRR